MFLTNGNRMQRWAKYGAIFGIANWVIRKIVGDVPFRNVSWELGKLFGYFVFGILLFVIAALVVNLFAKEK